MNHTIEILQMSPFRRLGFTGNIIISVIVIITLGICILVQKQIFVFLKRKNERLVNKILISNEIVSIICFPIWLISILAFNWTNDLRDYS